MDTISVLFISIIICLGGLTAYIADFLGRYMGKKKLSFLGIRPKYTAISFTIFSGILIPFITILILYYSSSDVRIWLEEGQNAAIQRDHKVKELEYMMSKIATRTTEVRNLEIQRAEAAYKLKQAQAKNIEAEAHAINIKKGLQRIKSELLGVKHNYKVLQKNFKATQESSISLTSKNQELLQLKTKLLDDLENKSKQTQVISSHLLELQNHVDDLNNQKKAIQQQFDAASNRLRQEIQSTQTQLNLARSERDVLLEESNKIKEGFDINLYNTRFTPIFFKQGEELATINIPPYTSKDFVVDLINELKNKATEKAKKKNAVLEHGLSEKQIQNIYETLTLRSFATTITLSVAWNTFEGESIPYTILLIDDNSKQNK